MYDLLIFGKEARRSDSSVANSCADEDKRVALADSVVGGLYAVHTEHTHIKRVVGREKAYAHHCRNCGDTRLFGKSDKLVRSVGGKNTAACADKRFLGSFESLCDLLHLHSVALESGLVSPHRNIFNGFILDDSLLNIDRNIYQDRTFSARSCNMESLLEDPWEVACVLDKVAVLNERHRRARNVRFLENVAADLVCGDLTRDADYRDTVGISGCYRSNKISCARSRCGNTYSRLVGDPCIAVGGMTCVCFMPYEDMVYIAFVKLIIERADSSSGITEDDFDTLLLQALDHGFGGFDLLSHPNHSKHNKYTYYYNIIPF